MTTTTLAAQGRLRIPAGVLRRERWKAGTKLIVEEVAGGVLLRPVPATEDDGVTTVEEVAGCLAYKGTPKTDAQIKAALTDRFRKV